MLNVVLWHKLSLFPSCTHFRRQLVSKVPKVCCTYHILLHLLDSTYAVIGQFSGPYLLYGPLKFKVLVLLPKCFVIYRQVSLTFIVTKSLKLSFTLNCILKHAKDLKTISN